MPALFRPWYIVGLHCRHLMRYDKPSDQLSQYSTVCGSFCVIPFVAVCIGARYFTNPVSKYQNLPIHRHTSYFSIPISHDYSISFHDFSHDCNRVFHVFSNDLSHFFLSFRSPFSHQMNRLTASPGVGPRSSVLRASTRRRMPRWWRLGTCGMVKVIGKSWDKFSVERLIWKIDSSSVRLLRKPAARLGQAKLLLRTK